MIYFGPISLDPLLQSWHIPDGWAETDLPLAVVPLTLLRIHIDHTSAKLAELILRVETVERAVLNSSNIADFTHLIRTLHACDADLIKLERRWHFEGKLASAISDIIDKYTVNIRLANLRWAEIELLESAAVLQRERCRASEYDLSVLPRRIRNQFTAVGVAASISSNL